ncbi:MAG: S8 family serine peptidase [Planctomycetota bacterium]
MSLLSALNEKLADLPQRDLAPTTVAVVDSGVDATHPDLTGRVVSSMFVENEEPHRIQTVSTDANNDVYGHGTAVAGIIAAIAPNAQIVDIRILDNQNLCTGGTLLAGFRGAVEQGVRVINMSLASKAKFASSLNLLCEQAYLQSQVVVTAKRNMPLVDNGFPAEFSSCISVDMGKLSSQFELLFQAGSPIEFVAQGEEVVVPAVGGGHRTMTGTSFATPVVAGLCVLLVGAYPDLRPFDVKSLLRAFAE